MRFRGTGEIEEELFFPISPFMIFPEVYGEFGIYLKKGRGYLLFTRQGEQFSEKHKTMLHENCIEEVYIDLSQKPIYDHYVEENLGKILLDTSIPLPVRSNVLYYVSTKIMSDFFESNKDFLDMERLNKLTNIARSCLEFFSGREGLKATTQFLSRDYTPAIHCVQVFIYSAAVFESFTATEEERIQFGLGTILHDIGKSTIPKMVLYKKGRLNSEERQLVKLHPVRGVGMCSQVPLGQVAINCILFHHEKADGSGYPAGLTESHIPLHAKIAGIADAYDALTTRRPYADPLSPSRALTVMREHFTGFYDPELINVFRRVLKDAGIITEE